MRTVSESCLGRTSAAIVSTIVLIWPAWAAGNAPAVPDFSGNWGRNAFALEPLPSGPGPLLNLQRRPDGTGGPLLVGDYNNPILKPEAAETVRQRGLISLSGDAFPDPSNQCAHYPPPYVLSLQLGMQMVQTKDQITILYHEDNQVRRVRLNSAHPPNVIPSAMGDSVGRFEGDTLVVDTVSIKAGPLTMVDRYGSPQSEALHLVERYRLIGAEEAREAQERYEKNEGRIGGPGGAMPRDPSSDKGLQVQLTVEDPNVFTMPWSAQVTYHRTTNTWLEQICAENFFEYYSGRYTAIPQAEKADF